MQKAILKVNGMTCPSCLTTIQTALTKQNGVGEVNVLFNAGKVKAVRAAIEKGEFSVDAEAIADKLLSNAQEILSRSRG